ncbi:hypothetical protein [Clostridium tyrobutyricum]|jgi:hypothetical protein|uniref:hypothetical protein n=1 Tax=Clostridium tyrobutyricum TaxID=1519 RepID=UPI00242A625F|nr:hypothetical protein [Clostridium tyrobutyricum]MCH4200121.1 hypothetical protein [Clostridium tyrobutyricum]
MRLFKIGGAIILHHTKDNKKIFLIGKDVLNFLINPVELYKKIKVKNTKCKECLFNNKKNDLAQRYCNNFCDKKFETILVPKYLNNYIIKKPTKNSKRIFVNKNFISKIRLKSLIKRKRTYVTALQSKLVLLYYKFANSKGIINSIDKKYLAKILGCSTNSIDNCNEVLQNYELITYQNDIYNNVTVILNNFNKQYKEDGSGYIVMASSLLDEIFKIKKLHEFRIAIKFILLYDSNNNFGRQTVFSVDKLKDFLPGYSQKPHSIKKFICRITDSFSDGLNLKFKLNTLIFKLPDTLNGKIIRKTIFEKYKKMFFKYISKKKVPIPRDKSKVLANLALEYNVKDILEVLNNSTEDILLNTPDSIGAYIRYTIKRYYKTSQFFSTTI